MLATWPEKSLDERQTRTVHVYIQGYNLLKGNTNGESILD